MKLARTIALSLIGAALAGAPAWAQGSGTPPSPTLPPQASPGERNGTGTGVMTPPTVDPGITKVPPPSSQFPTHVIPPPGSPGGDTRLQPK
jgi:hypothetical protein